MRLGLYGGTFDPIHNAHLAVAEAALQTFELDRMLLIPNRYPPHKESVTGASYVERLKMVQLACEGHEGLEACDIENHDGKSYTIATLEQLRIQYGDRTRFYFLIGADAFAEVLTWYRVAEVFRMTEFIVASRPGFQYAIPPAAKVHRLDSVHFTGSSTEIRRQLAAGAAVEGLPFRVAQYIQENSLYQKGRVKTA
ncbi:nicotinate-nucleotide adenylyltransferase [Bryobacter aggregatus]|uniref:nicotinate-nucleotide adenylyltransferase n=1 Tax=Bryobacter aggregatus TaxID=360054 RepID=UPI0004E16BDF|nr:nicotinate-nucleotide adenylyltransferase [Bryobacter aggregatus]